MGEEMKPIGIITGSGLYELSEVVEPRTEGVSTPFGDVDVTFGKIGGAEVAIIARHNREHRLLPNMINYQANMFALGEIGARAIMATSVVGVTNPTISLARIILFDDLFFIDNRLPDGQLCTIFEEPGAAGRGHLIFEKPFSPTIRNALGDAARSLNIDPILGGTYAHVNGPRFNSRPEIALLRSVGADAVSQTSGPEAVLAGELEIPYQLIGFSIDYANGVSEIPTPPEELERNLALSAEVLPKLIRAGIERLQDKEIAPTGFMYRFE